MAAADDYIAEERLWLNADQDKLVPQGHKDAAFLFAIPGDVIPAEKAKAFGLGKKKAEAAGDKKRAPARNKGA